MIGGVVDGTGTGGSSRPAGDRRPGWRRRFDGWPRWLRVAAWLLAWPLLGSEVARRRLDLGDLEPYAVRAGAAATAVWLMIVAVAGSTPAPSAPLTLADGTRTAAAEGGPQPLDGRSAAPVEPSEAPPASESSEPAPPPTEEPVSPPTLAVVPPPDASPEEPASATWTVRRVVDGDTLEVTDPAGVQTRIRLAQVDAPEVDECFGDRATAELAGLAGPGTPFTLRRPGPPYADPYGRTLGELVLTDGSSVNVRLVRRGAAEFAEGFADEDPDLARRMDAAEATARAEGAGLWSACAAPPPPAPEPAPSEPQAAAGLHSGRTDGGWSCHPAYRECLPDGPDLDCADVGHRVHLLGEADPYRLDGNSTTRQDGVGCQSNGEWSAGATYPYY